jgi:hypothetical protein
MTYEIYSSFDHVMARMLEAWQTRLSKAFAIFENLLAQKQTTALHTKAQLSRKRPIELQITLRHNDSDRC